MSYPQFTPQYLQVSDLPTYNLPDQSDQPDILTLVQMASSIVDEACGRIDGDGAGSLVYTTYTERILLGSNNRNLIYVGQKPISTVDAGTVATLQAMAASGTNYTYTGVVPNTLKAYDGTLSGIVGASGRYGYTRADRSMAYPDLFAFINPLNLVTMFGGPAPFISIDVTNTDYSSKTGEVWIPAGLQLQRYSEILIQYNSGYNPLSMPAPIKHVCASITKNLLAKGDATTALIRMNVSGGADVGLGPDVIDPVLDRMLMPYKTIRAY